jgi:hypothetical protein
MRTRGGPKWIWRFISLDENRIWTFITLECSIAVGCAVAGNTRLMLGALAVAGLGLAFSAARY